MKTLRALIGVALIVGAIYVAWMLVPPYFNNYKFEGAVADEARMNTYTPKSEDAMRETIYQKAKDFDIPVTRDAIVVQRSANAVDISVNYTVHVDLPVYPIDLKFQTSSRNKAY